MKQGIFRYQRWRWAVGMALAGWWGTGLAPAQDIVLEEVRLGLHGAGDVYQMRWGNTADNSDLISLPPRWYRDNQGHEKVDPGCFLQGSVLRVVYRITNNTGMPLGCVITVSLAETLRGGPMPECLWEESYGTPEDPRPYPAYNYVDLPAWPDYIVPLRLAFHFTFYLRKGGRWQWVGHQDGIIENFTVLGPPQAPMDRPWIQVLRISCDWMRHTSTELSAQSLLTQRMFGVKYDAAGKAYVKDKEAVWWYDAGEYMGPPWYRFIYSPHWYPSDDDIQEDQFWLQDWLTDSGGGTSKLTGQCTEISDLWVIMATSVGCARRIQLINEPEADDPPTGDWFSYNPSYWAGHTASGPEPSGEFNFHQVAWADVYDAAIAFPNGPLYIDWHDSNSNGIIDGGETSGTAQLATGTAWDDYSWKDANGNGRYDPGESLLWAGGGTCPYRYRNPTLTVSFVQHPH